MRSRCRGSRLSSVFPHPPSCIALQAQVQAMAMARQKQLLPRIEAPFGIPLLSPSPVLLYETPLAIPSPPSVFPQPPPLVLICRHSSR